MSSSPSTPPPLDYQTPPPARRKPVVDLPLAITCFYSVVVLSAMLLFVVPYVWATQSRMMMDFGVKLPVVTTSLIGFSRFCQGGGIILIWIIFALPPFVVARLQTWPPPEGGRRYFRPSRLIVTALLALFCVWIVVGLVLPHITLLDSLGGAGKQLPR